MSVPVPTGCELTGAPAEYKSGAMAETLSDGDRERKVAFITGVTGQDGSYLVELLLQKGARARTREMERRRRVNDDGGGTTDDAAAAGGDGDLRRRSDAYGRSRARARVTRVEECDTDRCVRWSASMGGVDAFEVDAKEIAIRRLRG